MASREQLLQQISSIVEKQVTRINEHPELETVLQNLRYNDYREEIEEAKPSPDPKYWARSGCNKCHGRGTVGMTSRKVGDNTIKSYELCDCATKAWQKWQDEFVEKLRKSRLINDQSEILEVNDTTPSEAATLTYADPKQTEGMRRIESIMGRVRKLHDDLCVLESRLAALPQRKLVAEAERSLQTCCAEVRELRGMAEMKERQAAQLDAEAEHYRQMAREAAKQATALRQYKNSEVLPAVDKADEHSKTLRQNLDHIQADLTRATHQVQKKIREVERQKDKLNSRIDRIRRECGLYDRVFTEETAEAPVGYVPSTSD